VRIFHQSPGHQAVPVQLLLLVLLLLSFRLIWTTRISGTWPSAKSTQRPSETRLQSWSNTGKAWPNHCVSRQTWSRVVHVLKAEASAVQQLGRRQRFSVHFCHGTSHFHGFDHIKISCPTHWNHDGITRPTGMHRTRSRICDGITLLPAMRSS
jgi:hypothetical protein